MVEDRIPKELIEEWLNKFKKKLNGIKPVGEKGEEFLKNIHAYIVDTEQFLSQGDYVKAWELISFAWGLSEAGEELEILIK